jgi:hypothetical protein
MPRAPGRNVPAGLLIAALLASTLLGLLVAAWGGLVMLQDARTHGEDWDGLGLFLGPFIVAGGLIWALLHASLAVWLVLSRRRREPLTAVGAVSAGVAGVVVMLGLFAELSGSATLGTLFLPVGVSLLVCAGGVGVVARP